MSQIVAVHLYIRTSLGDCCNEIRQTAIRALDAPRSYLFFVLLSLAILSFLRCGSVTHLHLFFLVYLASFILRGQTQLSSTRVELCGFLVPRNNKIYKGVSAGSQKSTAGKQHCGGGWIMPLEYHSTIPSYRSCAHASAVG